MLWDSETAPEPYRAAVAALARAVSRAPVDAPFPTGEAVWGTPEAGGWMHFALRPERGALHRGVLTARQAMAARREDFRTLSHALAEYDRPTIAQALKLLEAEALSPCTTDGSSSHTLNPCGTSSCSSMSRLTISSVTAPTVAQK